MARTHYFGAQCIPLNRNRIVCTHCGKVKAIGQSTAGRRAKCSPTLSYEYLGNGATGQRSAASGKLTIRSQGHTEYRYQGAK
jgi:hypothetical protein